MASIAPNRRTAISIPSEYPKAPSHHCLVMIAGSELGRKIELGTDPVEIGRSEECAICVNSDKVSRRHAVVQRIINRYHVADLKSTNGTYVNEQRVERAQLEDGDLIRVGKTVLKYTESNVEIQYFEHVDNLANKDALTGTFNKRYFDEALAKEAKRAQQVRAPLSMILFDIDHFKKTNDTYGHLAGDAVLKGVASTVQTQIRASDLLCRVGGEEFALILPNTPEQLALQAAEFVRSAVESAEYSFEGLRIPVTISLGVAELVTADFPSGLYKRADEKLYAAKRAGRNRVG